jgi:hypothetical protein
MIRLRDRKEETTDDQRSGRPREATTPENIEMVCKNVESDKRVTGLQISDEL